MLGSRTHDIFVRSHTCWQFDNNAISWTVYTVCEASSTLSAHLCVKIVFINPFSLFPPQSDLVSYPYRKNIVFILLFLLINQLHDLMEFCIHKGSNNLYPEPNQPNSLYRYLFFLRSLLILSSHLRLRLPKAAFPVGLPVAILKTLLPSSIVATFPAHLNLLDFLTLSMLSEWLQTMKFLMEPSLLPIPRGPKYSPQDPIFRYP